MSIITEVRPRVSLDVIQIAAPCPASWDKMTGDERERFCGECRQQVFNISNLSRVQAEEFLGERLGAVCVRFFRRTDGTILTRDCPVGLRLLRRGIVAALTSLATLASLLAALCCWRVNRVAADDLRELDDATVTSDMPMLDTGDVLVEDAETTAEGDATDEPCRHIQRPFERLLDWVEPRGAWMMGGFAQFAPSSSDRTT